LILVQTPGGLGFDGENIWVSISNNNSLMKFRASDGALLATIQVGSAPNRIVFDGANIWVANAFSNNVMKLDPGTGTVLGTFTVANGPSDMIFDGANIWVASGVGSVTKLRASDGALLGTLSYGF
jgi:DNA-binding beta-propeller fold protein YncE